MAGEQGMSKGISATGETVVIHFGGRRIETMAGQSVLAALVSVGEKMCRTSAAGEPRGMFCGMGVCQECIVDIDGGGNQRACMTPVREGMIIEPLPARPEPVPVETLPEVMEFSPDLLVIGGGPAGLAAAAVAAEAGLDVLLIDERAKLGGQFYKQPADGFHLDERRADRQFVNGRALIRRVETAGVRHFAGMTVWAAFGPGELVAGNSAVSAVIRPKRLVLATGAYERGVPIPGWTLPGFMTTGAAQTLLRSYQTSPGKRVLIAGNGPLNLQVAAELTRAGVEVVALAEAARKPGPRAVASLARMAMVAPDLVRDGLAYQRVLRRAGVPTFHRHAVVRAEGPGFVRQAAIAEIDDDGNAVPGTEKVFAVDAVCTGSGFLPSNEIARALGCSHHFDERRGHLVADRDEQGRSTVENVWIVGDSGGLGGARIAQAGGLVAGADVAKDLGKPCPNGSEISSAMRTIVYAARFQDALWELFRAPRPVDQLAEPETLVCRCEEISVAAVRQAIAEGLGSAGAVKRLSRAGMGRCQGRYCGAVVVDMVARASGDRIDEFSYFAPRLPFKPMPIAAISARRP